MIINPFRYIVANFTNLYSFFFDGVNESLNNDSTNSDIGFDKNNAFSYSFWAKFDTLGVEQLFISRPNDIANQTIIGVGILSTNAIRFRLGLWGGTTNRKQITTNAFTAATNTWYNITVTYDGSDTVAGMKIYIDSVNQSVTTATGTLPTTINYSRIRIGARYGGNFLNGNMDEVSVWNKALSGAEITELYNSGVPSNLNTHSAVTNLKAWWRMGDGATFGGANWTIPDEIGTNDLISINMDITNRTTDVP
jgi:hypothetical protein